MSGHDQPIHMPPPSLSPVIIAIGVTFISFGILWSVILVGIGVVLLLVGIAFDCQEVPLVPNEDHDVIIAEILTESGLRRFDIA